VGESYNFLQNSFVEIIKIVGLVHIDWSKMMSHFPVADGEVKTQIQVSKKSNISRIFIINFGYYTRDITHIVRLLKLYIIQLNNYRIRQFLRIRDTYIVFFAFISLPHSVYTLPVKPVQEYFDIGPYPKLEWTHVHLIFGQR